MADNRNIYYVSVTFDDEHVMEKFFKMAGNWLLRNCDKDWWSVNISKNFDDDEAEQEKE